MNLKKAVVSTPSHYCTDYQTLVGLKRGYTLIEVMIALSVFAIIATISSTVMYHAFDIRARVAAQANHLNELQLAITLIQHDTTQFIPRSVRANDMHVFSSFVGTSQYMEFTRGGSLNPNALAKRSTLSRIAYLCNGQSLIRRSWVVLDTPLRNQYEDKILLDNLTSCSFGYVSIFQQIMPEWRAFNLEGRQKMEALPSGIQMTINPYGWGKMVLFFVIPEGLYAFRQG